MNIIYEFFFENNRTEVFELKFNELDLSLEPLLIETEQPWTRLETKQCSMCTLKPSEHPHCPVARNLSLLLLKFKDDKSYDKATTRVTAKGRITEKHTTLAEGVSPLMGLIMATSGCPVLDKFKPMAFIHLPFANENETIFRAVGMYLTAQYFKLHNNQEPDWELKHFKDMYGQINQLNMDFSERIREIKGKDTNINALILLDLFAQVGTFSFNEDWMKELEPLFGAYLKE